MEKQDEKSTFTYKNRIRWRKQRNFSPIGKNSVKMVDFQNHRCFTLRCLSEKVVPVSIKLKSQVKTPKGLQIIRKAEVSLLNERINNTINILGLEYDTCMRRLRQKLKEEDLHECLKFIEERKEARHYKTMTRQKEKLEILCRKSNRENNFERGGHSNNMPSSNYMYSSKNEKMTSQIRSLVPMTSNRTDKRSGG